MHGSVGNYIVHVGEYACTLYNCIIHRAKMCDEHISLNKRAHFAHFPNRAIDKQGKRDWKCTVHIMYTYSHRRVSLVQFLFGKSFSSHVITGMVA